MVRITLDSGMLEQLAPADRVVEICDPKGNTVGYFHPALGQSAEKRSVRSPVSDEELQQRRQLRSGRSLAEILERLESS